MSGRTSAIVSGIVVRPVGSPRERRLFLRFPWQVYRHDRLWVPPLLPERARTLDPCRGPFFQRGEAQGFLAWRGRRPVGTICAAEDRWLNRERGEREAIFGFFECLEDHQAARALVEAAASWAAARGLTSLAGPFNLDYEDGYGVLVDAATARRRCCAATALPTTSSCWRTAAFAPHGATTWPTPSS